MDYFVRAHSLPQPSSGPDLLSIDEQHSCPEEVAYEKEIIGPEDWKPGAKTRKAIITRYTLKKQCGHSCDLSSGQFMTRTEIGFVAKALAPQHVMEAQREVGALRKLQGHSHIIQYLTHVNISGTIRIALSPAACCDLSDFLSNISQKSSEDAYPAPAPCHLHEHDWCFIRDVHDTFSEEDRILPTPLYANYDCQIKTLWTYFPCLCSALTWIHKNGFCHRDIKPNNILVESNGNVVMADFGSAETFDTLSCCQPPRSIRELKGCAKKFAAPEVYQLKTCHTTKSDVFSLGLVFTEMLTLIAGKTLVQYSAYRLGSFHNDVYWKQPVYACTLKEVQQWLRILISRVDNIKSEGRTPKQGIYSELVEVILVMIQEDESNRLTAVEAANLCQSVLGLRCVDFIVIGDKQNNNNM